MATEAQDEAGAAAGGITLDPAQRHVADRLAALAEALSAAERRPAGIAGVRGLFKRSASAPVQGLYIHGTVGRGKTMLMDMFFARAGVERKRRWHFHEFMADIHDRIAAARAGHAGDPLPHVAASVAAEARLLCLDELQVTDIADAMILGRLFERLFGLGLTLVATSNVAPDRLYWNGLNRQLFLPFVDLIERHMEAIELRSAKDYRLDRLPRGELYVTPADAAATATLGRHMLRLTGGVTPVPQSLDVKGRKLRVPAAAQGVARFHFADLCASPLSSLDYLHISHAFHTVLIDAIPVLGPHQRNEARRFINLVDTLYDQGVCLIASAEAEPHLLYPRGEGADLFERTASRLMEMRSDTYLARESREPRSTVEGTATK